MIYLARKDGGVVHHTSMESMRAIDGIDAPETTVSEAEFEAAGGTGGAPPNPADTAGRTGTKPERTHSAPKKTSC
jgi:hypothetical protein